MYYPKRLAKNKDIQHPYSEFPITYPDEQPNQDPNSPDPSYEQGSMLDSEFGYLTQE